MPSTLAWLRDEPAYAREGNIVSSGAALAWTADLLALAGVEELVGLAGTVPDAGGVSLVPALSGLGAPHWDRTARAAILDLDAGSARAHVARAGVEAVAHQICDVVDEIERTGPALTVLRADGGVTASGLVMQTQADLLGRPVQVALDPELSALGAARLGRARLTGRLEPVRASGTTFEPTIGADERTSRRAEWSRAVARVTDRPGRMA